MSTLLLERDGAIDVVGVDGAPTGAQMAGPHGGPTLDELITGVWEGLLGHETVACPACGGAMAPRYAAGAATVGGSCRECGTELA